MSIPKKEKFWPRICEELERCENADRYDIPSVADIEDLMFMIED